MERVAAAPGGCAFIKHQNQDYVLSPLTLEDMQTLEVWAASHLIERVKARISELKSLNMYTDQVGVQMLSDAWSSIDNGGVSRVLSSMSGCIQMLYISLKKKHPELTIADVGKMVQFNTIGEVQRKLDVVNGLEENPSKPPSA